MNYNLRQLIKYCQICGNLTKKDENNIMHFCTNINCFNNVKRPCVAKGFNLICINDNSNINNFTIFINKRGSLFWILLSNKKIYFNNISDLIKYYKEYRKNRVFL